MRISLQESQESLQYLIGGKSGNRLFLGLDSLVNLYYGSPHNLLGRKGLEEPGIPSIYVSLRAISEHQEALEIKLACQSLPALY